MTWTLLIIGVLLLGGAAWGIRVWRLSRRPYPLAHREAWGVASDRLDRLRSLSRRAKEDEFTRFGR